MRTPLLEMKLYVPRCPRLVPRPRLGERLGRGTAGRDDVASFIAGFPGDDRSAR